MHKQTMYRPGWLGGECEHEGKSRVCRWWGLGVQGLLCSRLCLSLHRVCWDCSSIRLKHFVYIEMAALNLNSKLLMAFPVYC